MFYHFGVLSTLQMPVFFGKLVFSGSRQSADSHSGGVVGGEWLNKCSFQNFPHSDTLVIECTVGSLIVP